MHSHSWCIKNKNRLQMLTNRQSSQTYFSKHTVQTMLENNTTPQPMSCNMKILSTFDPWPFVNVALYSCAHSNPSSMWLYQLLSNEGDWRSRVSSLVLRTCPSQNEIPSDSLNNLMNCRRRNMQIPFHLSLTSIVCFQSFSRTLVDSKEIFC